MMVQNFNLQEYLTHGVERVVANSLKATLKNSKESAFMLKFAAASRAASKKRLAAERRGEHIPAFLIASITSSCNLHCAGCFSRGAHATEDCVPAEQLTAEAWGSVFDEAEALGVSFILLIGGEPLLRRDVIEAAGKRRDVLFPIFTNGVFMDEAYFSLFDKCRNLLPFLSIEGGKDVTDARRGQGIYDRLTANMEECRRRSLIFGASITLTTDNLRDAASDAFIGDLGEKGCKAILFIEYVPVTEESRALAPGDKEREYLRERIACLRNEYPEIVFLSFPGDEKSSGGCIAAGRGFFHINSHGGAEPCPFSPYSDVNVKDMSLREVMKSALFETLRNGDYLMEDHAGGCILYEKRAQVEALLQG
ncbi:MAG: radical SAM protein [Schwartzia sp.]|nr:radical SAM protein [Schwartzia sp. (in: firmicutes)]